jgi:hypothetical protein
MDTQLLSAHKSCNGFCTVLAVVLTSYLWVVTTCAPAAANAAAAAAAAAAAILRLLKWLLLPDAVPVAVVISTRS